MDPRARAAPVGHDPEQPGQCALATLGERESGTARLEEAVDAYRAALEERTRERVPLDWAMTQNNLGAALGPSASGRAARRAWRRRSPPTARRWRNGPASACRSTGPRPRTTWASRSRALGERESGTERLEEAVAAYRAALEERTRERVPLDWAMTQMNLGLALWTLGERTKRRETLVDARAAIAGAFEAFMAAGQEHRRAAFEAWLANADATIARMERR
jgi:exonuclease VII small subunit